MKCIKHIIMGLLLFLSLFFLTFFLTDKNECHIVDNYVQEPRVYVTKYGDCYHAFDCHYLSSSRIEKGLYDARSKGYRACSYCDGTPCGTIAINYYKTEVKDITNEVAIKSIIVAAVSVAIYATVHVMICFYNKIDKRKDQQM